MLSKILLCTIRGKWVFHKSHVFLWIFFFLKDSVNSLISICFSDLKDQKLPVSAIKTQTDNNRPKILLARRAHKRSRQLACSNYGPNLAIRTSANVKTWFLWNYFKIWHVVSENKIFFALYRHEEIHVCLVQKAPIHQSHIYWQIKILQTVFEKGHPRNIAVKLFQNLTSSFGEEDFLRISKCPYSARSPHSPEPCSKCPYSARSPHSPEPCLWTDQNFANNFWKGSPKEHSCEINSKSD